MKLNHIKLNLPKSLAALVRFHSHIIITKDTQ